jgi:Txe/YoeB family toxin of Txe-Axe toxin-antitoxin module
MNFKIEINMDNAAFQLNHESELQRILMDIANKISTTTLPQNGNCRDLNGNTVGKWSIY